jgi:hypothetical protein
MSQNVPSLLHEADEFLFLPLLLFAVQGHRRGVFRHMNDTGHVDDAPTTTNYTTGKLCLDNPGACESEGDKHKHRASKRTKKNTRSKYGIFFFWT